MKLNKIAIISILVLVIIAGTLVYTLNNKEVQNPNQISEKNGKYFDENQTLLGTCTTNLTGYYSWYYKFYDLKGNLLGSCWRYSGPGSSGGNKGGCDEDAIKNNIATIVVSENIGRNGTIAQKYSCIAE